jgi:hypothetical protein
MPLSDIIFLRYRLPDCRAGVSVGEALGMARVRVLPTCAESELRGGRRC